MKWNETLKDIKNYEAGKPIELVVREYGIDPKDIIKLASNENPYGTSLKVVEAVQKEAKNMYRYPDDSMYELKNTLAKRFGVESEEIIVGSGSDQVLEFAARALLNPSSSVLMSKITFAMYEIYAAQQGAKVIKSSCYRHDLDEFYDLYKKHKPSIIHICTPNNPTGDAIDKEYLLSFLEKVKEPLVIVDGAYMEYVGFKDEKKKIEPKELLTFENVLYLGTFSKAFGLGGMRVGYGIANKAIIKELSKMRPPFNITTLSLIAATKALEDMEFVNSSIEKNFLQMDRYINFALQNSIEFIDSYTNFITYLLPKEQDSSHIAKELLKRGVIIRDLAGYGMNAIRITIGKESENSLFFQQFEEVFNGY